MTAPFVWAYTLADDEAFDQDQFNDAIADLVAYVNAMQAQVDSLVALGAPDLSDYVTTATHQAHVDSSTAHVKYVIGQTSRTALAGTNWDGSSKLIVEVGTATLSGGAGSYTFSTAFPNGLLAVQLTPQMATAAACSFDTPILASIQLNGGATDVIEVLAIGW